MKTALRVLVTLVAMSMVASYPTDEIADGFRDEKNANWTIAGPYIGDESYYWNFSYVYGGMTIITLENLTHHHNIAVQYCNDKGTTRNVEILWSQFPVGDTIKATFEHKAELEIWYIVR